MFKVAVVDYDKENIENMLDCLETNENVFSISGFDNSYFYLKTLEEKNINVSFIRIDNLDLQGLSLASDTLKISPETKIVFMANNDNYAVTAFEEGAVGYLTVPAEKAQIDGVIFNIIKRENIELS